MFDFRVRICGLDLSEEEELSGAVERVHEQLGRLRGKQGILLRSQLVHLKSLLYRLRQVCRETLSL